MPKRHSVEPGDCLSSIAFRHGFAVDTVWNHPDNEALRQKRPNPYLLVPGDVVTIPELRKKEETCAAGALHRFKRRDVPERLKLKLSDGKGQPRANLRYVLYIDGRPTDGTTDGEGRIEHPIPPDAERARLVIGNEEYELHVGHLAPVTEEAGVRARLAALGYLEEDEANDRERYQSAVRAFQRDSRLAATGQVDDATRESLKKSFGA